MSLVEIKYFNALIDNKPFFNQLLNDQQEANEKLVKMWRNDDYTQQEVYYIFYIIEDIINSLVQVYQDKQIQVFVNKLFLQKY